MKANRKFTERTSGYPHLPTLRLRVALKERIWWKNTMLCTFYRCGCNKQVRELNCNMVIKISRESISGVPFESGLSMKDEMYNKIIDMMAERSLKFHDANKEGSYFTQNCALSRQKSTDEVENCILKCNSMDSIRKVAVDKPEIKEQWEVAIEPLREVIKNRFKRLSLKDEPIEAMYPTSEEEMDILKQHLNYVFPQMNTDRLF
ncbi:hypothetical protein MAR_021256 [Mya arenaria]|uniref:Uncharacterized protein n=1 Tax=Mya arenaria TaxID=6604 RepID=A0ABY7E795_MYAAR|nr:hypothetical protein MAR_021256 [Mya arenaria]